jgi:photosystem II stability/assembly factor-like uncharacterized protein
MGGASASVDITPNGQTIVGTMTVDIYGNVGLCRSDDYGVTWENLNCPIVPSHPDELSISSNGQKILVGGNSQLFLSEDGGASWTEQMTALTFPTWYCCTLSKDGTMMLAGQHISGDPAYGGRLYLYKNGAWAEIQPIDANRHEWNAVSLSDSGNVVFAGVVEALSRTLYSSVDYGASWRAERVIWPTYSDPEPGWNAITCRATIRVLVGTNGKRLWLSEILPTPLVVVVHSFPWIGRFQLCHKVA